MLNKVLYIAVSCFYRGSFSWFIMENNNLDIFDLDILYKIVLNIYDNHVMKRTESRVLIHLYDYGQCYSHIQCHCE